jgi:hypothetical protein
MDARMRVYRIGNVCERGLAMKRRISRVFIRTTTFLCLLAATFLIRSQDISAGGDFPVNLPLFYGPSSTLLPNGDFEAGRMVWVESSAWNNVLIVDNSDLPRGIAPYGGNWAAWLGGDNNEEAAIEQTVFIDPAAPYLSYWYWFDWPMSCQGATGAVATVSLGGSIIEQTDVCEQTDTGGWVQRVLDVNGFAGQSLVLRFQLVTEANSYANVYLDDVAFQSSP